jgi:hypothetical protein
MSRRLLQICAALLAISALTFSSGCGGDGSTADDEAASRSTAGHTAPATVAKESAPERITKQRVEAYADAINLRPGEVPDAHVVPAAEELPDDQLGKQIARCAGIENPPEEVARVRSPSFEQGTPEDQTTFYSAVEALPTAAAIRTQNASFRDPVGFECASRLLSLSLERQSTEEIGITDVTVSRRPNPLPDVPGAFAFRVAATAVGNGVVIPVYIDALAFLADPVEVNLLATGTPDPPSAAEEKRLLEILRSRAGSIDF